MRQSTPHVPRTLTLPAAAHSSVDTHRRRRRERWASEPRVVRRSRMTWPGAGDPSDDDVVAGEIILLLPLAVVLAAAEASPERATAPVSQLFGHRFIASAGGGDVWRVVAGFGLTPHDLGALARASRQGRAVAQMISGCVGAAARRMLRSGHVVMLAQPRVAARQGLLDPSSACATTPPGAAGDAPATPSRRGRLAGAAAAADMNVRAAAFDCVLYAEPACCQRARSARRSRRPLRAQQPGTWRTCARHARTARHACEV